MFEAVDLVSRHDVQMRKLRSTCSSSVFCSKKVHFQHMYLNVISFNLQSGMFSRVFCYFGLVWFGFGFTSVLLVLLKITSHLFFKRPFGFV